ncbi:hypothetical protein O3M35_000904 [Rhynocoris fuscipes]|uniref:Uncharacterized protein n=1 Tax=Rhynocoris fuscipes TaxID=488301 RepID=A0AAW1DPC7_9HEMI
MCHRVILLQGILYLSLFTNGELFASKADNKEFADKNEGLHESSNVIKIDSTGKRIENDKEDENLPSVVLEFNPQFFSNPLLKNLYTALLGSITSNEANSKEIGSLKNGQTFFFDLIPSKYEQINIKRQLPTPKVFQKDPYGFHLTIKPVVPHHLKPVRFFNDTCQAKVDDIWCVTTPQEIKCEVFETTPTITTTCHPHLLKATKKLHFCGADFLEHHSSPMPCAQTATRKTATPLFTMYKSSPPPTVKQTVCAWTTGTCKVSPTICVTRGSPRPTIAPLSQKCPAIIERNQKVSNKKSKIMNENSEPDSYILIFKRSPTGSRFNVLRKKRKTPKRRKIIFKKSLNK